MQCARLCVRVCVRAGVRACACKPPTPTDADVERLRKRRQVFANMPSVKTKPQDQSTVLRCPYTFCSIATRVVGDNRALRR